MINGSLAAADTDDPLLRQRAATEMEQIALVRDGLATRVFLVPWLPREPIGPDRLRALAAGRQAEEQVPVGVG